MNCLPAFYFPTTVLYIDDDQLMLDAYKQLFQKINYHFQACQTVSEVESHLTGYKSQLLGQNFFDLNADIESVNLSGAINLNLQKILDLASSKNKYKEISLLLCDFYLKDRIDGLELCKQYQDQYFKKMLLTVSDNYNLARQALNSKVIDYFANKTDAVDQIKEAICHLTTNFFCDATSDLIKSTVVDGLSPLTDEAFVTYFMDLIKSRNIVEYYLIDKNGSYLLIDNTGKKYALSVHSANSFLDVLSLLREYSDLSPVLDTVQQRGLTIFFGVGKTVSDIDVTRIEDYLYPALLLQGKQQYFVHLLEQK